MKAFITMSLIALAAAFPVASNEPPNAASIAAAPMQTPDANMKNSETWPRPVPLIVPVVPGPLSAAAGAAAAGAAAAGAGAAALGAGAARAAKTAGAVGAGAIAGAADALAADLSSPRPFRKVP